MVRLCCVKFDMVCSIEKTSFLLLLFCWVPSNNCLFAIKGGARLSNSRGQFITCEIIIATEDSYMASPLFAFCFLNYQNYPIVSWIIASIIDV